MDTVKIYTDGACQGNPGPGGWGAILVCKGVEKEISGYSSDTTNNRMEIMAVIEALKCLKRPCEVVITTDSKYVCDSINKNWAISWRRHNWIKSDGSPAKNSELWDELLKLLQKQINYKFVWVKGHNGHKYNERCDRLAVSAIEHKGSVPKLEESEVQLESPLDRDCDNCIYGPYNPWNSDFCESCLYDDDAIY